MTTYRKLLHNNSAACSSSSGCVTFSLITLGLAALGVCIIFIVLWVRRLQYRKAIRQGTGVPAKFLVSYNVVSKKAIGSVNQFKFMIRNPANREEIKEDSCPVCLDSKPKATAWIVFDCHHATCEHCFREIVKARKLHATCPFCRSYLATPSVENADRGDDVGASHAIANSTAVR